SLTTSIQGVPGYSSYAFCGTQCSYDMFVASPAGHPDTVWIGGSMIYGEIFYPGPFVSNGRAVQRSTNAGVGFTDMTNDASAPLSIGMHPDQHAIAFVPGAPDIAIIGSDGGLVRTDGSFVDASAQCADPARGFAHGGDLAPVDRADCLGWLKAIPHRIIPMNAGLQTLQFEHVSVNPQDPANDLLGGTQDNGTWAYNGRTGTWFETVGGDGGQSAINAVVPTTRMHTYFSAQLDVNFSGGGTDPANEPLGWDWISDVLVGSGEAASFYVPLIADPVLNGTFFVGLEHVWRTQDNGGPRAYLDTVCNEFSGTFSSPCGDWVALGTSLTSASYGPDKGGSGSYVVAIARAPAIGAPLWVGTRRGRLFVSMNADAADETTVAFTRIDTAAQPTRFPSGIAVDPKNPLHAFVSFSGYDAYTPTTVGHVFEVTFDPVSQKATWVNRSANIGDQPITGIAYDAAHKRLYAATDFGVIVRKPDSGKWVPVAAGLPRTAVYSLTLDAKSGLLYAATHGRGVWSIALHGEDGQDD
ncbi:MAG: exo-alpha-sialidase, partial [Pseudomonadota bacterium]|nr:exo-alpha-sialidase [Pseudomonadota bacterium]